MTQKIREQNIDDNMQSIAVLVNMLEYIELELRRCRFEAAADSVRAALKNLNLKQ